MKVFHAAEVPQTDSPLGKVLPCRRGVFVRGGNSRDGSLRQPRRRLVSDDRNLVSAKESGCVQLDQLRAIFDAALWRMPSRAGSGAVPWFVLFRSTCPSGGARDRRCAARRPGNAECGRCHKNLETEPARRLVEVGGAVLGHSSNGFHFPPAATRMRAPGLSWTRSSWIAIGNGEVRWIATVRV